MTTPMLLMVSLAISYPSEELFLGEAVYTEALNRNTNFYRVVFTSTILVFPEKCMGWVGVSTEATHLGVAVFDNVIIYTARKHGLIVMDLRALFTEPEDFANPIEPSVAGGKKMAKAVEMDLEYHGSPVTVPSEPSLRAWTRDFDRSVCQSLHGSNEAELTLMNHDNWKNAFMRPTNYLKQDELCSPNGKAGKMSILEQENTSGAALQQKGRWSYLNQCSYHQIHGSRYMLFDHLQDFIVHSGPDSE